MSDRKSVLLIDVEAPIRHHIHSWARRSGQGFRSHSGETASACDPSAFSLAFLGGDANRERLLGVRKALPSVPVITILSNPSIERVLDHAHAGAATVIDARSSAEEVAERSLQYARVQCAVDEIEELVGDSPEILEVRHKIRNRCSHELDHLPRRRDGDREGPGGADHPSALAAGCAAVHPCRLLFPFADHDRRRTLRPRAGCFHWRHHETRRSLRTRWKRNDLSR